MKIKDTKVVKDWGFVKALVSSFEHGGKEGEWIFFSRKKEQTAEAKATPDAVVIVPFIHEHNRNDSNTKLLLTKEFRVPLGSFEFGFPAGLIDPGMSVEDTAIKELKEETGYKVTEVLYTTPPIYSSAGATDESVVLVFVSAVPDGEPQREEHEDIENLIVDWTNIADLLTAAGTHDIKIGAKAYPILLMCALFSAHTVEGMLSMYGQKRLILSGNDSDQFVEQLLSPQEPNDALRQAAKRHGEQVDSRD